MKVERIRLDDDGSIVATIDCDIEALTWLESYLPVKDEASKRISRVIGNILARNPE
jgi:hypothetical protein